MTVFAPEQVELAIKDISDRISKGVRVCAERYTAYLDANREYDHAYASAYVAASERPAHERRYVAEIGTTRARQVRDEADAAYRYADRQAKALELELRALQSVGASVRAMYSVAGRGEP